MAPIPEEQSEIGGGLNYDRLSLRNLARVRHNSSVIESSYPSIDDPMIK